MRKTIIAAAILLAALPASAQEVSYALPRTAITVEVAYTQDIIHAGKYAKYAKDLLGLEVALTDTTVTSLTQFRIKPRVEADQSRRYTLNLKDNSHPTLLALTAQGLIAGQEIENEKHNSRTVGYHKPASKPEPPKPLEPVYEQQLVPRLDTLGNTVYDTILVEIPVVDPMLKEATEAAEDIKDLREQRYKILIGDTDASYSGEALGAALAELTKLENELLLLFEGSKETIKGRAYFDLVPDKEGSFAVFTIDPDRGPVRPTKSSVNVYDLVIKADPVAEPEALTEQNPKGKKKVHQDLIYRIPALCTATLTDGAEEIMSLRIPVYQLGLEATYPIYE